MDKKLDKKEVRTPDQVTQGLNNFMDFIQKNAVAIGVGFAIFIVAGLGLTFWDHNRTQMDFELQAKFSQVEREYLEKKEGYKQAEREEAAKKLEGKDAKKDKKEADEPKLVKASGDLSKDYENIPERFETLIKENPNTKAAQMAAIHLAELYSEYNQKDKAYEALDQVSRKNSTDDILSALVVNFKASLAADKGECPQAVDLWQKVMNQKRVSYMHDEAKLRMALCYEKMNEVTKAEQFYTELSQSESENMDRAVSEDAKKYLRLLRLRTNGGT